MVDRRIRQELASTKKEKPAPDQLQFGKEFTDHMFIMDYTPNEGWHDARIVPYQNISIDPSAMVFHYGQSVFEGLKAYLSPEGEAQLFRPDINLKRINNSNERMCIPKIDEEFALDAMKELVALEKDWIPEAEGTSLYIRPFIISTEPFLGVAPSHNYKFIVILSPVGAYYKEGINPVKIAVENKYVRAVTGGTGEAKTGGNYASSLKAQEEANKNGYAQVLWLDGVEKEYIEEVGSMNVFFKINGEIVTPELNGSILEGVTRSTAIRLLEHWNYPVSERRVSMQEVYQAHQDGQLEEAFGTGTAAVVSPIGQLSWGDQHMVINEGQTGEVAKALYDNVTGIQYGTVEDPFGWITKVNETSVVEQ
ncbi:branched-chain amino acid aminotransferase [Pontibacillus marinus]|uniref:Branched-chain-amino-acid aminotransferase n=1 Tax=Pontibacillus marinus BH030004 = DSM 16465 TaxID=1385511 RepID=A0A0A5G932_9BACI|nr:branched-chain amino acid aminotransferase [Pontibacillus marinus]KGX89666.1 branched-chain amino acid aminotransferase [Pontibacillus marinus BH030004 = DSM 16465]